MPTRKSGTTYRKDLASTATYQEWKDITEGLNRFVKEEDAAAIAVSIDRTREAEAPRDTPDFSMRIDSFDFPGLAQAADALRSIVASRRRSW